MRKCKKNGKLKKVIFTNRLRSVSNILAGEFRFASSDRGEISHHHMTIVDLSVGVAWPSQGMVGSRERCSAPPEPSRLAVIYS